MVTTLDQREMAFEQAFAHDAELRFQILAHRNKLLGRWAADLLGYRGEQADRYVKSIVDALIEGHAGDEQTNDRLIARVATDFANARLAKGSDDIRAALSRSEAESRIEVREGGPQARIDG